MKKIYIILIIFLIISNTISIAFLFSNYNKRDQISFSNPYPFIDPARSIIPKEHFLSTLQPVREEYYKIVEEAKPNKVGIYIEYLNTGANISINQDERFWPASLSKLPTAIVVMKKIEKGEWKLSNELVLFEEDRDDRFGDLYKKENGTRFTVETLLRELLSKSDNTAHKILVRNIKSEEYSDMLEALGMERLFDEKYDITAKEYSRLFRSLYSANYLNREHAQMLLKLLSESHFDTYLASGLPKEIIFSHKIGEEHNEKVYLDSGIVYVPNRPYLLTVMIQIENGGEDDAKAIMKRISKSAYEYIKNN